MCAGKGGSTQKPVGVMRIKRDISCSFMENKNKLIYNWNYSTNRRGMQSRHCMACSFSKPTLNYYREWNSLTTSQGTLLACLRGRLPVNFSQSLSVSWEPTAVTSQVPEAEIGILSWCKFSLLSRRVPPFQSSKACITCHQPQVSFHRSNVNKYIHYHQKGRKQPMLVPESLLVLL